jgi:hypothetical protein
MKTQVNFISVPLPLTAALESQEELGRKLQCFGSASVSMRIRIQFFTSMWIQIQGATPMRIRIQILVRLCRHKTYLPRYKNHFEMLEIRLIC